MVNQEELGRIIKGLTDLNDDLCLIHDKEADVGLYTRDYMTPNFKHMAEAIQKVEMAIVLLEKLQKR